MVSFASALSSEFGGIFSDPKVVTFTGSLASYTPTKSGIYVIRTDTVVPALCRTTGTSAGNVEFIGAKTFNKAGVPTEPTDVGMAGMTAIDTTTDKRYYHNGTAWVEDAGGSGGGGERVITSTTPPDIFPTTLNDTWVVSTPTSPGLALTEFWVAVTLDGTGWDTGNSSYSNGWWRIF